MTSTLHAQHLHSQTFSYVVVPPLFTPDEVERYAGAPVRLLDVVDGLLGENRPWHTDVAGILHDYCSMKTLFYGDPVSIGQGSLTIFAASHTPEYSRDIEHAVRDGSFDIHSLEVPGKVKIESAPGDLIAVDHRLWKTSRGAAIQACRFFALEWAAFPRTGWEEIFLGGYRFFRRDILNK